MTIPASVTTIGFQAFEMCYHLEELTLPASVTSVLGVAFWQDYRLKLTILNPECTIADFSNSDIKEIHAPSGSSAETFAKQKNIRPLAKIKRM